MAIGYDVAVIGAGINGLAISYELTKRGHKVITLERSEIGAGASGSCDDMILLQSKKPGILLEMAFSSLEIYKSLSEELDTDLEFETRGGMILIENEANLATMTEFVASQNRYGLDVKIVDRPELKRRQPFVADDIIASTVCEIDSQVNPLLVMRGFFEAGTRLGLEVRRGIAISGFSRETNAWHVHITEGKDIVAPIVIDAAGAWAGAVSGMAGFPLPIKPRRGQVAVTEQIPRLGDANVWSAQYVVSKLKPEGPVTIAPGPAEKDAGLGIGFALTGTRSGNYFIGSTREDAGYDKATAARAITILARQAARFFPVLGRAHIIRTFAGFRPATPDGKPFIGELPGLPGFFVAAGHEGDGIALAPITGRVVSDLVEGKPAEFPLDQFSPGRFAPVNA